MTRATEKNNLVLDLRIDAAAWKTKIRRLRAPLAKAIRATLDLQRKIKPSPCEIAVILTDDRRIKVLNHTHRNKNKATNVLSFPLMDCPEIPEAHTHLGDIVLAFETIDREAKTEGKRFAAHFIHLAVHGTLHLCGYDHIKSNQARTMEKLETAIMISLGLPDPHSA